MWPAVQSGIANAGAKGLGQTERQQCLGRNMDGFAARQHLRAGSTCSAGTCADGCAFSATRNRADNRADCRTTSNVFTGTFVCSDSFLSV
jgi:hypothetical protein